ncbi:MAG: glycerophosphodiester phosphodiesterase [Deltaproteobacteria bacterium]|nr:glycerophosphodiester phosphodiesterase [Deltaproteobacteria bacterium]
MRFRPFLMVVAALTFLSSCSDKDDAPAAPAERRCAAGENLQACGKNLVIAHRGGAKLWPEESLLAFQNAVASGSDVLELDVHGTKDGKIVCIHDEEVDRTTDGTGKVKEKTLAELQALDAAAKFSTDGGKTFPYKGTGVKIATLEEVLRAFPQMPVSIEIKQYTPPIVDEVIAIVEATGMSDKVLIASFDDDTIRAVRAKRPKLLTSFAMGEILKFLNLDEDELGDYKPPAPVLQPPYESVNPARMRIANKLGIRIHAWTVDDSYDQERLWKLGVHGIMSDDPVLLKKVTKDLGLDGDKGR